TTAGAGTVTGSTRSAHALRPTPARTGPVPGRAAGTRRAGRARDRSAAPAASPGRAPTGWSDHRRPEGPLGRAGGAESRKGECRNAGGSASEQAKGGVTDPPSTVHRSGRRSGKTGGKRPQVQYAATRTGPQEKFRPGEDD